MRYMKVSVADGVRMRWVAAQAKIGDSGEVIEIIAAHVMTQEARVLSLYLDRVWITVVCAVLVTLRSHTGSRAAG